MSPAFVRPPSRAPLGRQRRPPRRRPWGRWAARVAAPVALVTLGLLSGCRSGDDAADAPIRTRVPVGLAPVVQDSMVETVRLTGRLGARPHGAADLMAPAAGVVRELRGQIGDRVARGAVLMLLDAPDLAADAAQKTAAADQAGREARRQHQLLTDGVTSERQAEEADAAPRQAGSASAAASALLARTRVTSPIAGRIQSLQVRQGERVEAGKLLAQVVAADTLDLVAPVPAPSLARLRLRQAAAVRQDGDTASLTGWVAAIAPGVDSLTNAGTVVIRVPNSGGRLYPGAGATALARVGLVPDALVVPDSAVVLSGDSSAVFVVGADSVAHQRIVTVGVRAGGRTQVTGDLRPGDRVATTGAFGLEDGMHVVPMRSDSAAGAPP